MKKSVFSFIIPLTLFSLAVFAVPSHVGAQTFECPVGFTCVPVSTSTPSITVLSPNGGEVFRVGQQMNMSWTTGGGSGTEYVSLILRKTDTPNNFPADSGNQAGLTVNDGNHTWTIGDNLELGQYILRIACEPVSGCPMVDSKVFTIASSTSISASIWDAIKEYWEINP